MAADETQQWRQTLTALSNKIPASLSGASVQVVRRYKSVAIEAHKALASSRTPQSKLAGLVNQLQSFQ